MRAQINANQFNVSKLFESRNDFLDVVHNTYRSDLEARHLVRDEGVTVGRTTVCEDCSTSRLKLPH
jgi:hypothetical protein